MAIVTESGYGAFLPTYENEFVNREALRGQMIKQASYLTEMDSVYAQLEEQARQFDVGLEASTERWKAELEERSREFDESNRLGWAQQMTSSRLATGQINAMESKANLGQQNLAFQQDQYANMQSNAQSLSQSYDNLANRVNTATQSIMQSNTGNWTSPTTGTTYNQYGQVVPGAGHYDYSSDANDDYWE